MRLRGQVSYVSRAITAEEYNAAVARAPADCPLFAAGDLRSGRQVGGCVPCAGVQCLAWWNRQPR